MPLDFESVPDPPRTIEKPFQKPRNLERLPEVFKLIMSHHEKKVAMKNSKIIDFLQLKEWKAEQSRLVSGAENYISKSKKDS